MQRFLYFEQTFSFYSNSYRVFNHAPLKFFIHRKTDLGVLVEILSNFVPKRLKMSL